MPTMKQIVAAVLLAIVGSVATAIIGLLTTARLEISFNKLKDFDPMNLATYKALGTSIKFDFEVSEPLEYVMFYVDLDNDSDVIRKATVVLKNFKINSRVNGSMTDDDGTIYGLSGFYNSDRMVVSHRGPYRGIGVYIMEDVQLDELQSPILEGFAIMENQKRERDAVILTKCPCVMVSPVAPAKYVQVETAKATYPLLQGKCSPIEVRG